MPSDAAYHERQSSYYSCSARALKPACIVRPQSTDEVAAAVRALADANMPFAVRSGGHTSWAGASSIGGEGVTIDLGLMDWVHMATTPTSTCLFSSESSSSSSPIIPQTNVGKDQQQQEVDLGPGNRWGRVYAELASRFGLTVAGGREGNVGVAGLILGGGLAFFSGRHGLACDNVVEYEVVLADGAVVRARADGYHADLFRALKGGGGNFGIVTNFRMRTLPARPVWAGSKYILSLVLFSYSFPSDEVPDLL